MYGVVVLGLFEQSALVRDDSDDTLRSRAIWLRSYRSHDKRLLHVIERSLALRRPLPFHIFFEMEKRTHSRRIIKTALVQKMKSRHLYRSSAQRSVGHLRLLHLIPVHSNTRRAHVGSPDRKLRHFEVTLAEVALQTVV